MPHPRKVAVLIGSLRKDSLNRKAAIALSQLAPASIALEIVEIGDLNLYNQDLEDVSPKPASWIAFRDTVRAMDAVLFVTPEYNRSVPGGLKNAIDVGSRPYGQSVFSGKPPISTKSSCNSAGASTFRHRASLRLRDSARRLPTKTATR